MSQPIPIQGLDCVRLKPGMYIGGSDQRALQNCVFELIANSMEEHLAGRGSCITVTIHEDGSLSVKDHGGGISVAPHPEYKLPFIELALTTLFVRDDHPRLYRALCGVGAKCVNAVSEWMRIETVWEGHKYQIAFARGRITEPLRQVTETTTDRGTLVRFKPDPEMFKALTFERNLLAVRLEHMAVMHPKLAFCLVDERPNITNRPLVSVFNYPKGIADFLDVICPPDLRRHPQPIAFDAEVDGVRMSVGFQFTESANTSVLSFANSWPTRREGTHVHGFLEGLAKAFNELAGPEQAFRPEHMRSGLSAFVGVWLADPRYGGSTKDELINPEVELAVGEATFRGVTRWAAECGDHAKWLAESLDEARRNPEI